MYMKLHNTGMMKYATDVKKVLDHDLQYLQGLVSPVCSCRRLMIIRLSNPILMSKDLPSLVSHGQRFH